jgi:hypothetical protein
MSRLAKAAKEFSAKEKINKELHLDEAHKNHMGGDSYELNPLETLKLMACSCIFGESKYYKEHEKDYKPHDPKTSYKYFSDWVLETRMDFNKINVELSVRPVVSDTVLRTKSTSEVFEEAIDAALDYDFRGTIKFAMDLRTEYFMRLNPQIIMVRAALHPKRKEFTEKNPGMFAAAQMVVMKRADEPATQLAYYLYLNKGKKNQLPSILKRSIALKLGKLSRYQVNKYKNAEIGMINAVRLTHATSPVLDELMQTGSVKVDEEDKTWEQLRSTGMPWKEIVDKGVMPHMAMLRNIRNVFKEVEDLDFCKKYMNELQNGVLKGKQFPFRYKSAYDVVKDDTSIHHRAYIMDMLEECIDISIDNLPKLKGTTVCLSDNSGSAWNAVTSEYGKATIAEIDNLSSVIAAKCSDEGTVIKFGNEYKEYPISKRNGALSIAETVNETGGRDVGHRTEGGIWKWFANALDNNIKVDNIFIFSDMQAGTGGLYGTGEDMRDYIRGGYGCKIRSRWGEEFGFINVFKLVLAYRKHVNPKVNVFTVQTAGYGDAVIPMMTYRCAILTGWTGKEVQFASEYIKQWDEIEAKRESQRKKLDETMDNIAREIVSNKTNITAEDDKELLKQLDEQVNGKPEIVDEAKKEAFDKLTKDMSPIGTMALKSLLNAYAKMSDEERKKFFEDINE